MDPVLLYTITTDMLEQGRARSKNLIEFHNNIIANLTSEIKKIIQEHPISSDSRDSQEYIRKAVMDFYRKNGMSAFVYFDKNKNIQISTTIKDANDNLCVFFLSKWLEENKKKLKPKDPDKNESFSQEAFESIIEFAKTCVDSNNELLFKDVVRNAIKKTFNLNSRDGLFFSKLGVYFKIFDFKFVKISNEIRSIQKMNTSRLLDDEDRLKINSYLKKLNLEEMLLEGADDVLNTKIDLENTNNIDFLKNFLFMVAQEFRLKLEQYLSGKIPSLLQTCFAEEKIRSCKNLIFEKAANKLLEMLSRGSSGARSFIDFYQGQIIDFEDKEVYIPSIIDSKGEKWGIKKIEQTVGEKFRIQVKIDTLQKELDNFNKDILDLEKQISKAQNEIAIKNKIVNEIDVSYDKKKRELQNVKSDDIGQREIISIRMSKYLEEKKRLIQEAEELNKQIDADRSQKLEVIHKQKEIQRLMEKEVEENQINFIQYNMLLNAFCNAMGGVKF